MGHESKLNSIFPRVPRETMLQWGFNCKYDFSMGPEFPYKKKNASGPVHRSCTRGLGILWGISFRPTCGSLRGWLKRQNRQFFPQWQRIFKNLSAILLSARAQKTTGWSYGAIFQGLGCFRCTATSGLSLQFPIFLPLTVAMESAFWSMPTVDKWLRGLGIPS